MRKRFFTLSFVLTTLFMVNMSFALGIKNEKDFVTDSIGFEHKDKYVECVIVADVPMHGSEPLCGILKEYISEQLGGTYNGGYTEMDSLISYYGKMKLGELNDMVREMAETDHAGFPYTYYARVRKTYETEKIVTYHTVITQYFGGAHPFTYATATTFRKLDGRRFGNEIFNEKFNEKSSDIIKDGLKKYFEVKTDEELRANLLNSNKYYIIPMPQNPPFFTKDGIVLSYGQYEIAPYAEGMPAFVIPYGEAKELLKVSAVEVIE